MTKEELIELVKERLAGGDAPASVKGRYHPNVIALYLNMAFTDLVYESYALGAKTGDFSQVDSYLQRYVYPVETIADTGEKFITLLVQPVPLPDNYAIRQVCKPFNQAQSFAALDNTSQPVFAELEVDWVSDVPGYYYEGNKIYFDDKFPVGLQNVMVKLIVQFSSLGDKDEVFVSGGNNTALFQKVCDLLLNKPPQVNQDNMVTKQV